jgi:hypothetical protein
VCGGNVLLFGRRRQRRNKPYGLQGLGENSGCSNAKYGKHYKVTENLNNKKSKKYQMQILLSS